MPGPRQTGVRLGEGHTVSKRPYVIAAAALGALVVTILILLATLGDDSSSASEPTGCKGDSECGPSRICAAGGCIPLLSSEHRGIWHDDIRAQVDAGPGWSPQKTFGVKLLPSKRCPAKPGKVATPPLRQMTTVSKVEIFEIGHTEITWFQQVGVKGTVWVDGVRLRFAPLKTLDPGRFCGSDAVVNVAVGKDKNGPFADFSLKNAAPANKVVNAAASLKIDAPKPDKDGFSTFTFDITSVFGDAEPYHTVLAVPLGADIAAIEGPAPTRQRLLSGFVAYYFGHSADTRQVRVRYKINQAPARSLDVAEINP